jgi:hypothetical protein
MSQNSTEIRQVSDFDKISLRCFGELTLSQGEVEALVIEASPELLPYITSEVKNGTLILDIRSSWVDRLLGHIDERHIRYNLTFKTLKSIDISGSARVDSGKIETPSLHLGISGSSKMTLDSLKADSLNISMSGSGDVAISQGTVTEQHIHVSGSGKYTAPKVESQKTSVSVSGSSHITVWAAETLDVSISGVSQVEYYGKPHVTQHVSGVAKVTRLTAE